MYKNLENNLNNFDKNYALGNGKYLIQMCSQSQNQWYKTPGSSWSPKRVRSKFKTRKATYHSQTRRIREATNGSR